MLLIGALFWACGAFAASITVTLPDSATDENSGRGWNPGALPARNPKVTWTSSGVANVKIDLYKGGVYLRTMAASVPAANGVFTAYTISNTHRVGGDFRVRVSAVENPAVFDESNNDFSISSSSSDTSLALVAQAGSSSITLTWSSYVNLSAENRDVSRRVMTAGGGGWDSTLTLGPATVTHTDSAVTPGTIYEYRVRRSSYTEGYIAAGIDVPLVDSRGTVLLLVDQTMAAPLAAELANHQRDLVGDGWKVVRHDVPRKVVNEAGWKEAVAATKAIVQATATAHPDLRTVSIIGHVPVPYSGDAIPDGHTEHKGAWPADGYYGELNGSWTDSSVNRSTATFARNHNVPGDGKFDQTYFPSAVDLEVGRVDFRDMPAFSQGETGLLRQYLEKNRRYRFGQTAVVPRALVDENFNEAFAYAGYRSGSLFGGDPSVDRADWFTTLGGQNYLVAYGNGGGNWPSVSGVGTTTDFATRPSGGIFTALFGSYFGDWDNQNNVLRAAIGGTGGLTSIWSARPHWFSHPMGMGETVGYTARLSMNADSSAAIPYANFTYGEKGVHMALLGDPTLRLHVVSPPSSLQVAGTTAKVLQWTPSPDPGVIGYHVYRAPQALGPYTRLSGVAANSANPSGNPITTTTFTDNAPVSGGVYMVRAVKNETGFVAGAGNYFNQSQGIFSDEGENIRVWDGGASSNSWSTAENWTLDTAPAAGNALVFGGTTQLSPQNDLAVNTAIAGIRFNLTAGAFTLSGNALTLSGNVVNESSSLQTISLAMALGADRRFEATAGPIHVGGALSSSGGVIKAGAHTLTLSGPLSYTGRTAIEAGTLRLVSPLTTSGGLQMSGTGTLDLNGQNATFTTSTLLGSNSGASMNTITDNAPGTGTTVVFFKNLANQDNKTMGALITDGASRKVGVKIANANYWNGLLINANSTYSGGTTLTAADSYGTRYMFQSYTPTLSGSTLTKSEYGTGTIFVGTNATDKASVGIEVANKTFHNNIVWDGTGTAENRGHLVFGKNGTTTFNGTQTLNTDLKMSAWGDATNCILVISGKVTGNGGLTLAAPANAYPTTVTLQNVAGTNDYAGVTQINRNSDILVLGANNQIPDGAGKGNVNATGTLRLNGFSDTINGLTGSGTVHNNHATTASTLTLGAGNITATFSGTLADGSSAALHLVKTGTGTQTLSGTNTYTGRTVVESGTLKLGSALTKSGGLQMTGSAALDLNGQNATFTSSASTGGHTATSSNTITDTSAGTGTSVITVNNNASQAAGLGALVTDGPARKVGFSVINNSHWQQLLTNANNTFSGGILVSGGTGNGSRLYLTNYTATLSGDILAKSQLGTGAITVGTATNVKGQVQIDQAGAIFRNEVIFNTTLGADVPGGIRFGVNNVTLAGKLNANLADASIFNNAASGSSFVVTAQITGTSGFQLTASGNDQIVTLSNTAPGANDYAGNTSILRATSTLRLGANNQIPDGAGKGNVNVTGTLRLNGFSDTINGLTGSGTVHNNHATTASTLTLGAGNATAAFSGVIANGAAAALHLVKTGIGTQTLSGTNSYTGNTTVTQGTLALAQATLANAASVSVSGTLRLDHAAADTIGGFVLNGATMWKGAWGPVGSAAHYQTPSLTGTGTLLVTSGPDPGFNGWAWESDLATLPPEQSGPQGNPDRDSNANLAEWVLGLDPLIPDRPSMSIARQPGQLEFTYQRSSGAAAAGAGCTVEWTDNLAAGNWRTDSVSTETLSDNGQTQTIKATITTGGGDAFVRLRVTAP